MLLELTAALLLTQAPSAPAAGFAATFTPEALASHLDGKAAYLVVGAGASSPSLTAAAAAVEEGLRRSGQAELVMNGASLGPVGELDDQALVKRCDPLPVARVAVVRVFEAAGEPPRAVVAVYDKAGRVLVAFTAQAGQPLAPGQKGPGVGGQGVSTGVAQAVLQVGGGAPQEEYDKSYLGFDDVVGVTQLGVVKTGILPHQGKFKRQLEGDQFYKIIGRDDLATKFHENESKRTAVTAVGLAVGLGVPLLALAGKSEKSCPPMGDPNWFDCNASNDSASMKAYTLAGAGLAAGLLIVVIGRNAVELHPIDAAEARRLAEEYNKKLKARLGVARAAPAEPEPPITQVSVSLAPLRGGGMVGLALTF